MTTPSKTTLLVPLLVALLAACPVTVPETQELGFTCHSDEQCSAGFACAGGVCVAAELVDASSTALDATRDAARSDASRPDGARSDASGTDIAAPDITVSDTPASDTSVSDLVVSDSVATDSAIADSVIADSVIADSAIADSAAPDLAAPDTSAPDVCVPSGAEGQARDNCDDSIDNDCDGDTDRFDDDCWWDAAWLRRTKLWFDNRGRQETLDNFPALVVLDQTRIDYGSTQASGEDLRFVDADDATPLAHEIERWDEGGASFVWIKVPRIPADSNAGYVWMYFGNSGAADGQRPGAVWSAGYDAVYHLDPGAADSTGAHHATAIGSVEGPGQIGMARSLDGVDDWIDLGADLDLLRQAPGYTLSAWIWPTTLPDSRFFISLSTYNPAGPTNRSRATVGVDAAGDLTAGGRAADSEDWSSLTTSSGPIQAGSWHAVTATLDLTQNRIDIYLDGAHLQGAPAGFTLPQSDDTPVSHGALGAEDFGDPVYWEGRLDEVRISSVVRSAAWINAQHASMTDDGLVNFGVTEAR